MCSFQDIQDRIKTVTCMLSEEFTKIYVSLLMSSGRIHYIRVTFYENYSRMKFFENSLKSMLYIHGNVDLCVRYFNIIH